MSARLRPGLRAQIVFALFAVFVLSFALLGTATLRLTRAAAEAERAREATRTAELLAGLLADSPDPMGELPALIERLRGHVPIAAVVVEDGEARTRLGRVPEGEGVSVALRGGARLSLWLERAPRRFHLPLANLLVFYVGLTGLAVVLLAYAALTWLVVRPLGELTRQSELLAAGAAPQSVRVRGAAEVVRLGTALNQMASQLRADRLALEQRLAELEATAEELRTTQRQLIHGEKLASVGRLAAGVAHEIGNPLAAILGLVELLRAGDVPEAEAQEFLERIHRETDRINGIIRDLLDFSRREPDDEVPGQTADLRQAIEDAVNLVRPQKESRQIALEVDVDPRLRRVLAPQHRLTQVLLNLLFNAVDALPGRGRVLIEARPLEDALCVLRVTDDGPGIPETMLDRLFEPFSTSKPAGKGTGLGLAVSAALVEAMGGSISANNLESGGACFEVRLRQA